MAEKIKYLAHPLAEDERAKWRAKGYTIIDARFAPKAVKKTTKK